MNRTFTPVKPATALKSVFLCIIFTALMGNWAWGQVYLIDPVGDGGFESGSTLADNGWTAVNTTANCWWVGTAAGAQGGSKSVFVGSDASTYTGSTASVIKHFYRDVLIPAGATAVYLNYYLKMPTIDNNYDFFYIYINATAQTPTSGTLPAGTQKAVYTTPSLPGFNAMPQIDLTSYAGTTIRLVFTYKTDAATPYSNPAVDNISLVYTPGCNAPTSVTASVSPIESCSAPQTVTFDVAAFSGGNLNGGQWEYEWREGATVKRAWSTTSSYAPSLSASAIYTVFMRSSACATSESTGASATYTYNSSAPTCAGTPSPANAATNVSVGSVVSWSAVAGATSYDVYFGTSTTPGFVANVTTNSYTPALVSATTYYWYVIPKNACGSASGCGTSNWSFATASCTSDIYVTATVGTLTGSYTTLKGAFDKINDGTHKGVISISVGRNTTETATAALNASGSGSASYTSVLVQPCGGSYTITGSLSGVPTVNLNGADNVTINGINSGGNLLTIANTSATAGSSAIQFINDATNNIVQNCNIYSSNISTTSGTIVFSTTTGTTGNDNNTIEYCSIYDGATAPYVGIYSSGTTTSTAHYNSNNTISNNKIYNFLNPAGNEGITAPSGGIFFTGTDYGIKIASGNTSWTISSNSLYRINTTAYTNTTSDATHFGIYVSTDGDGFTVSNNYIGGSAANCSGTPWTLNGTTALSNYRGIQMKTGNTAVSTVSGNVIANILFKTSAAGTSYGAPFIGIHINGNFAITGNIVGDHAYGLIEVACISSNSDFNGIFYYNEAVSGPALWTVTGNTVANIKNANTSGNASFYGIRCFSKECSINMTCSNNMIGGSVANSILLSGTANSWVHGIFVSGLTSAIVSGNTVRSITSNSGEINGIKLQDSYFTFKPATPPSIEVVSNTVYNLNITTGTVYGIINKPQTDATPAFAYASENVIHRNFIYSISGPTVYGIIELNQYTGFNDHIRNNMVATGNTLATSKSVGIGYSSSVTGTCNIYHNSVYIDGSSTTTYCMEKTTAATACNIKNNIFYNNCNYANTTYALYYSNTTGLTSDCNDLYVPKASAKSGYAPSTGYTTLANWQAGTVYDDNSVSIDPGFLSITAPYNLHVDSGIRVLNCTGLVTDDFDNEARVIPHIGADEAPITLPVSLVRFDASCNEEGVMIFWTTASEINNNYFTLERSGNLAEWLLVAKVPGVGNSNTLLNYSYIDQNLFSGVTYYRLTQTDFNGESETFDPVMVRCGESLAEVSCYPNPFSDQLVVTLQNIGAEQGSLVLRDVTGRVVMQRELSSDDFGQQSVTLTLSGIASGVYSLEFRAGSYEKTMRVVKNK